MAVCSNCKREVRDNHIFCGYCGASLKPSVNVIIDGRKDKRIRYLINRACHFEKINILFSIVLILILFAGALLTWKSMTEAISRLGEISAVIGQLQVKYGYYKEGLGISYLYHEIEFLFSFADNAVLSVFGIMTTFASAFFLSFNTYILYLRKRYKESYSYKKPLRLIKICVYAVKAYIVTAVIFLGLMLALDIIKIIML